MTASPLRAWRTDDDAAVDQAILGLLAHLRRETYRFVTPNRSTHRRVRERRAASREDLLRDVFGWVRPAAPGMLPRDLEQSLFEAGLLTLSQGSLTSRIRVSSIDDLLLVHSAPEAGQDAVFLGPDSYRYARFLRQTLSGLPPARTAIDIGVGAGVGALTLLAHRLATDVSGTDVNPLALRYAELNALHAALALRPRLADGLPSGPDRYDLIIANPPFIAGQTGAIYKDGGDDCGSGVALQWTKVGLDRLNEGGHLILYTGAPIVRGVDLVKEALSDQVQRAGLSLTYEEIDPDIFGGLLGTESYRTVERIAAIGAVVSA